MCLCVCMEGGVEGAGGLAQVEDKTQRGVGSKVKGHHGKISSANSP